MTVTSLEAALEAHRARFAAVPGKTVTAALVNEPEDEAEIKKRDRQPRDGEELQGLGIEDQIAALYASPYFWEFCRQVFPNNDVLPSERGEGAPQHYPDWLLFLIMCVAGSPQHATIRKGVNHFRSRKAWRNFVADVHEFVPPDMTAPNDLPKRKRRTPLRSIATARTALNKDTATHPQQRKPLARKRAHPETAPPQPHHMDHFILRWRGLTKATKENPSTEYPAGHRYHGISDKAQTMFRKVGMQQSHAMGILHPGLKFYWKNPDRMAFLGVDGSVFKTVNNGSNPLYVTGETDEKGKPLFVRGSKWTIFSSRVNSQYLGRVLIDLVHTHADHPGSAAGESEAVLGVIGALKELSKGGIRGLLVDSVIRGKAVTILQREHGIIVLNYCHAEENPGGHAERLHPDRIEKSKLRWIAVHTNDLGNQCEHPIFANGGEFVELVMTVDGTDTPRALEILDYESRQSGGTYRERLKLQIPDCPMGDAFTVMVPLFHDNPVSTAPRGENWGEVVRVYPPGSKNFKHLYGARNDTEARHADLKARAKHLPADVKGQLLRLIGACMAINAAGYQVHLQAHGKPNVLDDTA